MNYSLRSLEAQFLKYQERSVPPGEFVDGVKHPDGVEVSMRYVETLSEADGIEFLCPLCFEKNGGAVGTHIVICWFVGKVRDDVSPKPGRWTPQGTGIDDLRFIPGDPPRAVSVLLTAGCNWHGFVGGYNVTPGHAG